LTGGGRIVGDVLAPGAIAPGDSPGTLSIQGDLTLSGDGTVEIEIGGLLAGTQYDVLAVTGNAILDGVLRLSLEGGFVPQAGDSFAVLTAPSITGAFTNLDLPALLPGLQWNTAYGANQVTVSIGGTIAYDPADFNQDGFVDQVDLAAWSEGFGIHGIGTRDDGDANGDGSVDGADFLIWQQQSRIEPFVSVSSLDVPEPGAWALAMLGVLAATSARRRSAV
jgi:MYXO-CTERM domain-containing protein